MGDYGALVATALVADWLCFVPVAFSRGGSASSTSNCSRSPFSIANSAVQCAKRFSPMLSDLDPARWQTPASEGPDLDGPRVIVALPLVAFNGVGGWNLHPPGVGGWGDRRSQPAQNLPCLQSLL